MRTHVRIGLAMVGLTVLTQVAIGCRNGNTSAANGSGSADRLRWLSLLYETSAGGAPAASARLRAEALLAFVAHERSRGIKHPDLRGALLQDVRLSQCDLSGVNFRRASFHGAQIARCRFDEAELSYANLSSSRWISATLRQAHLWEADLREADMAHLDLAGACVNGVKAGGSTWHATRFDDATLCGDWSGVKIVDAHRSFRPWAKDSEGVKCCPETQWPVGFSGPGCSHEVMNCGPTPQFLAEQGDRWWDEDGRVPVRDWLRLQPGVPAESGRP